ncbi:MAG: Ig-like domain-containing protein [Yersinia sp. (in: enterobacteria)]
MDSILHGIEKHLLFGFLKKIIAYTQIVLQISLSTLPLYSMSFSTQANSDITKKTTLFKHLYTLTSTDTLESVASTYGLSVDELWALNINLYINRSVFDAIKYGAVVYVPNQDEEPENTQQASLVASHFSQIGNSLSSENSGDAFSRLAKGMLLSSTAKTVEEWLGPIGQAQVKLQSDDKHDFSGSEVDLFIPLYDQPDRLVFSQFGFRRIDKRNIMNIGLGQRHYMFDWMLGYNVFFDQQISGNTHRRGGFGGEIARDYVKLSANSYYRLGGWKNSTRLEDYDERAANGYDIRTEAYLPHYPQLGGKLMYEQYFGDEVALFGINERQKNPSALTAGVSYTPIPLVSLGLDHTIGNSGKNKTGLNLAVNYEINTPWQKQIDPAAVQATRTLDGSRMDLVDRNNNIVLEYRKQQVVTLNLPEKISGKETQILPVNYTFNARYGLDRIEWDAVDVIKAGGQVSDRGNLSYHVVLPPYIDGAVNAYVLSGRAVDKKGNYSTTSSTNIYVTGVNINSVNSVSSLTPPTLPANATSRSLLQLALKTDTGKAVGGVARNITFAVRDVTDNVPRARSFTPVVVSDALETQTGVYEASVTSGSSVGRFEITATVRGVQLNPIILTQTADVTTATIYSSASVSISTSSITANGTDKARLEVQVTDAFGHPVPGVEVKWASDLNSPGLEHATSVTNEHGIAENVFSSTVTGTAHITVQAGASAPIEADAIQITADNSTMRVNASDFIVTNTPVVADGVSKALYKLKVTDIRGNVVSGAAVEWSSNIGSFTQGSSTTTTDTNGETFIELVSTKAVSAKVTAMIGGKPYNAGEVTFIADRRSAYIALLPLSRSKAAANDNDWITLMAKIVDAHNNPIKNEEIFWHAASHKVIFDPAKEKTHTNDLGESQIKVASAQVGDASLTAQVVSNDLSINKVSQILTFSANAVTAKISDWLAPTNTTQIADGQAQVTYKVVVKDSNGHPVAHSQVLWQTNLGEFTSGQVKTEMTQTDSNGEATIVLSSVKAGIATVQASVNGNKSTSPANVEFIANSSSAKIIIAPMIQRDFVANGSDKATYNVTVFDANNNPVNGEGISWNDENGHPVSIEPKASQTGADGKAVVNISSLKAGKAQISAKLSNNVKDIAQPITFNADRQTAKIESVLVSGNKQAEPNGHSPISYITTVKDDNDNLVSGMILSWGSNINKVTSQTTTTEANGTSYQAITGTQAGKVDVSVQLTSGNYAADKVKNNEAEFVAVVPAMVNSDLLLQPNLLIADGKQTATLRFTLRDANHNPVFGRAADIEVTQFPVNSVTVGAITESTVKGVYQAKITGMKEGTVDLTAVVKGSNVSKTQKLTLQADNKTARLQSVTRNKTTAKADGVDSVIYTATVTDAQGNTNLDNVSVGWRTNLGELAAITKTDAAGKATTTLTSKQAGTATVTAIVSSTSEKNAATVDFTADVYSIAHSSFDLSHTERVADGVQAAMLRVALKDVQGNPVAGKASSISVAQSGLTGLVLPSSFIESNTGVYTAQLTSTIAGKTNISATVDSSAFAQKSLTFIANVSTAKIADVKPMRAGTLTVGEKLTYRAEIKDANDNPLGSGIPVHWSVNSDTLISGGKVISLTDHAGMAEIEISRDVQGDALVTAAVGNNSKLATAVNFTRGNLDIHKSKLTLLRKEIIANGVDIATLQVDISDNKGNPLPHLESQITTSPKDGEQGLKIETVANPSGGYLVNIKGTKAGDYAVTVFAAGNALPNKVNVVLMGDSTTAKLQAINVNKTTFKANDVDQVIYTAEVVDVHNNPLENYPVSWSLAKGEGTYDGQSYTNTMGIAETSLRANRLGEYKMDVWVRGNKNSAQAVNSTAGDVDPQKSGFAINVASIDASGKTKAKLTVTLKDKFDNILTGQQVNIRDISKLSGLVITPQIMMDNNDGTYSAEVSATKKGNAKFIASINGVDLIDEPQLRIGNIIPQLSFDNKNVTKIYTKAIQPKQLLRGLPPKITTYWSSDNTDIATVNAATGEIQLLKAGIVNIAATTLPNENYAVGQASYQLTVDKADPKINFTVSKRDMTWRDSASLQDFALSNSDITRSELNTIWQSDDNNIATVDSKGLVALVKPGTTKIKVVSFENERFKHSEASYDLSIAKYKQPLSFAKSVLTNKDSDRAIVQQPNEKLSGDIHLQKQWSSSDNNIVEVANDGTTATLTGPGKARITLKIVGNDWYEGQSSSYEQEVYVKPTITITKTTARSKHVDKDNERVWSPVFTDDKFEVILKTSSSDYEKADHVTVTLLEGNNELASKSMSISSNSSVEFNPQSNWVGKNLKIKVVAKNSLGQENEIFGNDEIKVENNFKPDEIWRNASISRKYNIFHQDTGNEVDSCYPWGKLGPGTAIALIWNIEFKFANQLLHPMQVTRARLSNTGKGFDKMDAISVSGPNFINDYNFRGNTRFVNGCLTRESGHVDIVITVKYQDKEYRYGGERSLKWDGAKRNDVTSSVNLIKTFLNP